MKFFRRKPRSLVRIIASIIPDFVWRFFLPHTPRMYLSASIMDGILSLKQNSIHLNDESFNSFKCHLDSQNEPSLFYSTPLKHKKEHSRIRELQRDLDEIQKQITKLMEHHCDQLHCSGYQNVANPSVQRMVW